MMNRRARITKALAWLPFTTVSGIALYRRQGLGMLLLGIALMPVMILAVLWWVRRKERRTGAPPGSP
jgi:hypothetical protein